MMSDQNLIQVECNESAAPMAVGASDAVFAESPEPVLRKGLLSIFDQAIVSGANFITLVIIARACSPAEVGVYSLAWTIVLFITIAQANLITIPYTMYRHRREGEALAEYGGSAVVHQFILSAVAIFCFVGLGLLLSMGFGPNGLRPAAWVLAGAIPFILLRDFARRFSFAHLAPEEAVAIDVVVILLQAASLAALWYCGQLSAATGYAVMGAACAVTVAIWWRRNRQSIRFSFSNIVDHWRQNWSFGRWAFIGQFSGLAFYALPWLLAFACGESETGKLAACTTLVGLSNLFVTGLNNFVTPKAAQAFNSGGTGSLGAVLGKALVASCGVLGCLCLGVYFVGDTAAGIIFGPTYTDTGSLLTVLAVAALVDSIGQTAGAGLWAFDRPAANFVADLAQVGVTAVVAIWLVFSYGALGIAVAIASGRVVGSAVRWAALWMLIEHFQPEGRCETVCGHS